MSQADTRLPKDTVGNDSSCDLRALSVALGDGLNPLRCSRGLECPCPPLGLALRHLRAAPNRHVFHKLSDLRGQVLILATRGVRQGERDLLPGIKRCFAAKLRRSI